MLLNYTIVSDPGHVFVSAFKRSGYVSALLGFLSKALTIPYYSVDVLGNRNSGPLQNFNPKKLSQNQSFEIQGETGQRE